MEMWGWYRAAHARQAWQCRSSGGTRSRGSKWVADEERDKQTNENNKEREEATGSRGRCGPVFLWGTRADQSRPWPTSQPLNLRKRGGDRIKGPVWTCIPLGHAGRPIAPVANVPTFEFKKERRRPDQGAGVELCSSGARGQTIVPVANIPVPHAVLCT